MRVLFWGYLCWLLFWKHAKFECPCGCHNEEDSVVKKRLRHQQTQSVALYDLGMYLRSLKTQIKIMECYRPKLKECRGFVWVPGLSEFLSGDSRNWTSKADCHMWVYSKRFGYSGTGTLAIQSAGFPSKASTTALCVKWTQDTRPGVQVSSGSMGPGSHFPIAWNSSADLRITISPGLYLECSC